MSKIRESASGKECQVRLPFVCNYNSATTVFAHLNGGGMGKKKVDVLGAYACSACHYAVDRLPASRFITTFKEAMDLIAFYEAIHRTQEDMLKNGLIKIG
jgi:hypothetical protein